MSKKQLNSWDRFWLTVKANEKIIWVGLLVLLSPTFAFTGYFTSRGWSGHNDTVATVYGRKVQRLDWNRTYNNLATVGKFHPNRFSGRDAMSLGGRDQPDVLEFLMYQAEADRLGIRVSDEELGWAVRRVYWDVQAQRAAAEAIQKLDTGKKIQQDNRMAYMGSYYQKLDELEKKNQFDEAEQQDWYLILNRAKIDREEFEDSLREVMKAEKLDGYVKASVKVTPQEILARYKEKEQSRKFSFFEVRSDEARPEVEKAITDVEVKDYFEKHREDFRQPLKISTEYLTLPVAEFEKNITLTDEEVKKEYDRIKTEKYQTFVGGQVEGGFDLLSPEEKAAREKKAFRPFEEVKDEVRQDLLKSRARDAAKTKGDEIRSRLFPDRRSPAEKKDEKVPPAPATFAEIQKDFPMAKSGTTPWVEQEEAEKTLGPEIYSRVFSQWFAQAEPPPGSGQTARKTLDTPPGYIYAPNSDRQSFQYLVFYHNPQVRPPQVPKLDEARAKVREALVKEKLLDQARKKAKALADSVHDGKKSLEEAAQEAGQKVITTGFVARTGSIKVPLTPEELKKAEAEKTGPKPGEAEESPAAKEKDHPASSAILEYGFKALREKGKVDGFAEDPGTSACYVVRWDDQIFPDPAGFEKARPPIERQLMQEKQISYVAAWREKLYHRAQPARVVGDGSQRKEKEPAPFDPDAE
jgi:hypothetical protein